MLLYVGLKLSLSPWRKNREEDAGKIDANMNIPA
jgi:hypothetical protein